MTIQSTVQTVTPELASAWLRTANTRNRNVRQYHVTRLAHDMKAGAWRLTHQGVAFAADGTLVDGQHRLAAVVLANVSVQMVVFRGVSASDETYSAIDTTAVPKRHADVLGRVCSDGLYMPAKVAALNVLREAQSSRLISTSLSVLRDELIEHESALQFMSAKVWSHAHRRLFPAAVAAAVILVFEVDDQTAAQFVGEVQGEMAAGQAAVVFLRSVPAWRNELQGRGRILAFYRTLGALRSVRDDIPVTRLIATRSAYDWWLLARRRKSDK